MKRILVIALIMTLSAPLAAQQEEKGQRQQTHVEISGLVSSLNASQKRKLEQLTHASQQRVDHLRKQQRAVRDSISLYMEREGDQSAVLYPLFDREAQLRAAVSREMYATKLHIDNILTPSQRQELRKAGQKKSK